MSGQPRRWRIAILLGIGVLVNYADRVNISVAHDALHEEFGISTVTFGYLLSSFNWTYALLQLPTGVLLDRFGVKRIGRISALLWSLATFGAAAAPNLTSFFGMRLLLGVGEAPSFPANAKATGYWFPREERSLATAIFDAAAKFGPAIGVPAIGAMTLHFGWRWSFAFTGLLSLLYFFAFYVVYRDPGEDPKLTQRERELLARDGQEIFRHVRDDAARGVPLSYLIRQPKILGLVIGFFGYNYCFYLLLLWLPTYFSALKLSPLASVLYSSVPWLFATATDLLIGGWLVDALVRRGKSETLVRQSILIGGTSLGLAVAAPMFTSNPVTALIWISVALGGLAAAAPVGWSIPALIAPRNSVGKVGSILNLGNQTAGIIAPIVTGYLTGLSNSFADAFAVSASLLCVGIASYVFLLGRIEPVPEPRQIAEA